MIVSIVCFADLLVEMCVFESVAHGFISLISMFFPFAVGVEHGVYFELCLIEGC